MLTRTVALIAGGKNDENSIVVNLTRVFKKNFKKSKIFNEKRARGPNCTELSSLI